MLLGNNKNVAAEEKYFHYGETFPFSFPHIWHCQFWDVILFFSSVTVCISWQMQNPSIMILGLLCRFYEAQIQSFQKRACLKKDAKAALMNWWLRSTFDLIENGNSI